MDNRLEAVALGLTEIARVYEGGKRIDTNELCAGLRNYAGMVRAANEHAGPSPDLLAAVARGIEAVGCLPVLRVDGKSDWHEAALKSLTGALVNLVTPPLVQVTQTDMPSWASPGQAGGIVDAINGR